MAICQMEGSGLGSARFTKMAVSFLIAFFLLYMLSLVYRSSTFDLIGGFSRAIGTGEMAGNDTGASVSEDKRSSQPERVAVDKLLGGLLAAGFDEESCIFISAADLTLNPYNRTLEELSSGHVNGTTDCSYVVWTPANGLGNRIISMASSFLYALLTNRVLLVDLGSDMAGVFCEPFPNTSWLLPVDFPLSNQFYGLRSGNDHSYGHLLWKNNMNISAVSQPPPFLYLYLSYNYDDYDKLFYKDQNQGFLQNVPWLILKSDQYFAPYLFLIPSFQEELGQIIS
ncbi:hypothetical protein OIU84_023585 [Salix udensis]|uniref:Fucosyltransferase n=1 Tax=Salix udensis TaxID=889485 RepID=A0AAD6KR51_9ROSI|nr:hypothetical protein OIU84_023585 [Salix udensis]